MATCLIAALTKSFRGIALKNRTHEALQRTVYSIVSTYSAPQLAYVA